MNLASLLSKKLILTGNLDDDKTQLQDNYHKLFVPQLLGATFDARPLVYRNHAITSDKDWPNVPYMLKKLTSRDHSGSKNNRDYDVERAEKFLWCKDLLLNYKHEELTIWRQSHNVFFQRVFIFTQQYNYIVILEDEQFSDKPQNKSDNYKLITGYHTEERTKRSLINEYNKRRTRGWVPK